MWRRCGSQSLLNVKHFGPDSLQAHCQTTRKRRKPSKSNVDLLETFNWLVGLTVQHIAAPQSFTAEFERDSEKRLRLKGKLKQDANGPMVVSQG